MQATHEIPIIIAASGTGGHLFPALFIAKALRNREPNLRIEFVGSGRPLEKEIIDSAGFVRYEIKTVGLNKRGLKGVIQFLITLPSAWLTVWRLFSAVKPKLVIGVGGYVSWIPVTIAFLRGIPTLIHESELRPGIANFVLSIYATRVSLAFEHAKMPRAGNTVFTGQPLRPELKELALQDKPISTPTKLLVMGGSQGAASLDQTVPALGELLAQKKIEVWHQCRAENISKVKESYESGNITAKVESFIQNPTAAYDWADLIISRSGASAVMEIGVVNKPVIFVPFPAAQGNHQLANAKVLADAGKALIAEEGQNFKERLEATLTKVLDPMYYQSVRSAKYSGRNLDGAERIAELSLALARGK